MYDLDGQQGAGTLAEAYLDIALSTWISVPIPGSSKTASLFHDSNVVDTSLDESDRDQLGSVATADDKNIDGLIHWIALEARLDPGVFQHMRELAFDILVLVDPVRVCIEALVSLLSVLVPEPNRIEGESLGLGHLVDVGT